MSHLISQEMHYRFIGNTWILGVFGISWCITVDIGEGDIGDPLFMVLPMYDIRAQYYIIMVLDAWYCNAQTCVLCFMLYSSNSRFVKYIFYKYGQIYGFKIIIIFNTFLIHIIYFN